MDQTMTESSLPAQRVLFHPFPPVSNRDTSTTHKENDGENDCKKVPEKNSLSSRYCNYPLLRGIIENENRRNKSLKKEGNIQDSSHLSSEGWLVTIFIWKGRAIDLVALPWLIVVGHAIIYTIIQEVVLEKRPEGLPSFEVFFGFVLNSTLSFLLIFRLNRAAERFWIARGLWGLIVARARCFVGQILQDGCHCSAGRDDAIRWLSASVLCTMELLRGKNKLPLDHFAGLLNADQINALQNVNHPPLYAANQVRRQLRRIFLIDADTPFSTAQAWARHVNALEQQVNDIVEYCGGLERIRGTPLPIAYVSHLRTFLIFDLLLMPYIWGPSWKWALIPIVIVTAFAWLGIEAAAAECESPFREDRVNALNMDRFCLNLLSNIQQQLQDCADDELRDGERCEKN